jgi:hypothetical protein
MPGVLGTASAASDKSWPARLAIGLALLAGICFHAVFIARATFVVDGERSFSLFDDAMISLTYARNLAAGDGLVWMQGEPPVEGYTNLLWTLLMALPHWAGLPERLVSLPIQAFGVLLLATTSVLAMGIARRLSGESWIAPATIAAIGLCYPLVFWTLRGLEVGLVACLVTAAALLALRLVERPSRRDRAGLAAVLVAAVSTRDDAAIFAGVIVAFLAFASRRTRRDAAAGALATAAMLGAHTAFRLLYYGALAPNTYYLKMSGHLLSERLARGIDTFSHLVACTLWAPIGLALTLLVLRRASLTRSEALLVGLVLAAMAYSVYVGGDAWEWAHFANRYVSTVLPLLLVLALLGVEALRSARGPAAAWGLGVAGLFVGGFSLWRLRSFGDGAAVAEVLATALACAALWLGRRGRIARSPAARAAIATLCLLVLVGLVNGRPLWGWATHGGLHVRDDENKVRQALAIRAASPADARIAVVWAGTIPYFSHRRAIDLLGKNDAVIARGRARREFWPGHDKWDYEYSIGQLAPDLVVELWKDTPHDRQLLRSWGYERLGKYWVRAGADIDRSRLTPGR